MEGDVGADVRDHGMESSILSLVMRCSSQRSETVPGFLWAVVISMGWFWLSNWHIDSLASPEAAVRTPGEERRRHVSIRLETTEDLHFARLESFSSCPVLQSAESHEGRVFSKSGG